MIRELIRNGVVIHCPESVEIAADVNPGRIAPGAVIHAGCRIRGEQTLICAGAELGREAPATVENCRIGPEVKLKGGYFKDSVFLEKSSIGSGAHVREGTILEEQASAAHSVGLKQTILFPFVTLGSLVNFCDCLMAGGTSRKNHSEVGSAYIHFNYTPYQDKAAPSLIGDVAGGVMLNQDPVFLGGQGGLVGPCRLAFGTVVAAGTICRKDELRPGRLIFGGASKSGNIARDRGGGMRNTRRIVTNNLYYLASLKALQLWYDHVRSRFISDAMPRPLFQGLSAGLETGIRERVYRLGEFAGMHKALNDRWPDLEKALAVRAEDVDLPARRRVFLQAVDSAMAPGGKADYIKTIQSLGKEPVAAGIDWLQSAIDALMEHWLSIVSGFDKR